MCFIHDAEYILTAGNVNALIEYSDPSVKQGTMVYPGARGGSYPDGAFMRGRGGGLTQMEPSWGGGGGGLYPDGAFMKAILIIQHYA